MENAVNKTSFKVESKPLWMLARLMQMEKSWDIKRVTQSMDFLKKFLATGAKRHSGRLLRNTTLYVSCVLVVLAFQTLLSCHACRKQLTHWL